MILIYGTGKVGQAVAHLCRVQNIAYTLSDDASSTDIDFDLYDAIVPSPGIPPTHPVHQTGKCISELDFAFQFLPQKNTQYIISITGTDGKSTTCWMSYLLFSWLFWKEHVHLCGNFEIPFSETVARICELPDEQQAHHTFIVEVSSFMSHLITQYWSNLALITNLADDHISYHGTIKAYFEAKKRLIDRSSYQILTTQAMHAYSEQQIAITLDPSASKIIDTQQINTQYPQMSLPRDFGSLSIEQTHFRGNHHANNLICALSILERYTDEKRIDIEKGTVQQLLKEITPLSHRGEVISKRGDRIWRDDGKATSNQALQAGLSGYQTNKVILIAGGLDKGDRFEGLEESFANSVRQVYLIWETKKLFAEKAKKANIPYTLCDTIEEAVSQSYQDSHAGDTILLCPGCASMDMFAHYLERSEKYLEAINTLSL